MPNVNWQFQAAIPGGPSVLLNQPGITVAAYDVAAVDIGPGGSGINVPIQPSSTANDVVFLVVSSDVYDHGINYTVDALTVAHVLDGPHVLLGSGAVGLLNSSAPPAETDLQQHIHHQKSQCAGDSWAQRPVDAVGALPQMEAPRIEEEIRCRRL